MRDSTKKKGDQQLYICRYLITYYAHRDYLLITSIQMSNLLVLIQIQQNARFDEKKG